MAEIKNLKLTNSNALKIPSGSTAQRPSSPEVGMIRYNTDLQMIEKFSGNGWNLLRFLPGLNYTAISTFSYINGGATHPLNAAEMDNFFDENNSGLFFGATGVYARDINFATVTTAIAEGIPYPVPPFVSTEYTAWKAEGYLYAPETGIYKIGLDSDDAADVFINNQLTANWYNGHGFDTAWENGTHVSTANHFTAEISLEAGNYYPFMARVESISGGFGLQVGWKKPPDSQINLIPGGFFYRTA